MTHVALFTLDKLVVILAKALITTTAVLESLAVIAIRLGAHFRSTVFDCAPFLGRKTSCRIRHIVCTVT